jgi:hypothetical protein
MIGQIPGHIDDHAPALRLHDRCHRPAALNSTLQINLDQPLQFFLIRKRRSLPCQDIRPGIIDPDIDAPELGLGHFDQPFYISGITHISLNRHGSAAVSSDVTDNGIRFFPGTPIINHNLRAFTGKNLRNTLANTTAGPGDDGCFLFKSGHFLYKLSRAFISL